MYIVYGFPTKWNTTASSLGGHLTWNQSKMPTQSWGQTDLNSVASFSKNLKFQHELSSLITLATIVFSMTSTCRLKIFPRWL